MLGPQQYRLYGFLGPLDAPIDSYITFGGSGLKATVDHRNPALPKGPKLWDVWCIPYYA